MSTIAPAAAWTFDPTTLGRLECDAWAAYYRHEWLRAARAFVALVDAGFRMGRRRTLMGAWYVLRANQAWAPIPDNEPGMARRHMSSFYRLVQASGHGYIDPVWAQGPGIVVFAHVRASARARAGSAAWCRRPAAMLSHPAIRSRLMATLRQVAMTRGACPVRIWDWSSA